MASTAHKDDRFGDAVDAAILRLVQREHFYDHSMVKLPILLPDGSTLVVQVWPRKQTAIITDAGVGFQEAALLDAGSLYSRQARKIAEQSGVTFEDMAFTADNIPMENIAGAIAAVADCTKRAMDITMAKLAERKYEEDSDALYARLVSIFDASNIERNIPFVGASTHKWEVTALVHRHGHVGIFEPVANHLNSVSSVVTKFHDIGSLEIPPIRVSVVESTKEMGDMISMLSGASKVIERQTPDMMVSRLLEAA